MRTPGKRAWWAGAGVVVVLVGLALMAVVMTTGCTLVTSCDEFDEHEYCVGDDCVCGDACTFQSCSSGRVCVGYRFQPTHGVCVAPEYQERHELELMPQQRP